MLSFADINCDADKHCIQYFDGCNACGCQDNQPSGCTEKLCGDDQLEPSTCLICEDEETMQYTECGGCDKTCDEPSPICIQVCQHKCECKPEYPYYSAELGKCIAADQCPSPLPTLAPTSDY